MKAKSTRKPKPKPAVPPMHPRERLTKKAQRAIRAYALARCGDLTIADFLIKFTIEAERMPRQRLYDWLESHGYKWNGVFWSERHEQSK